MSAAALAHCRQVGRATGEGILVLVLVCGVVGKRSLPTVSQYTRILSVSFPVSPPLGSYLLGVGCRLRLPHTHSVLPKVVGHQHERHSSP